MPTVLVARCWMVETATMPTLWISAVVAWQYCRASMSAVVAVASPSAPTVSWWHRACTSGCRARYSTPHIRVVEVVWGRQG